MQMIVTSRLSKEKNYWLSNLRNDIKDEQEIERLAIEYQQHKYSAWHQAVMDAILEERFLSVLWLECQLRKPRRNAV